MNQRIPRALAVEDHPLMATAIATAVSAMHIFERVDTAASLAEAVQSLEKDPICSLAILDLHLGDAEGRESLNRMREHFPDVPVLVFSGDESLDNITMAFECNARGYVTKSSPMTVLNGAIQLVLAGSSYIPPEAISILGFRPLAASQSARTAQPRLRLSGRQDQVFQLLLQGMPNKVIAARLSMAEGTAKAHLNTVFRVLGVRTRVEAILRAREMGLI
jgi:DNA-binding NarL/FixJ family response regulator